MHDRGERRGYLRVSLWELQCSVREGDISIRVGDWGDALSVWPASSAFARLLPVRVVGFAPPGADLQSIELVPLRMAHVERQGADVVGSVLVLQHHSTFVSDAVVRAPLRRHDEVTARS